VISTRPHLKNVKFGEITQGTVFSCVKLDRYEKYDVLGLVITARCDIAQLKFPVLNYLPIVPIRAWFECDGLHILLEREEKDYSAKIRNTLSQAGLSDGILISTSLEDIGSQYFPKNSTGKAQKASKKYWDLVDERNEYNKLRSLNDPKVLYNWFVKNRTKQIAKIVDDLSKHNLTGFYLFETLLPARNDGAWVCLLRDVSFVSKEIAIEISNGLSLEGLRAMYPTGYQGNLTIAHEELAMPLICVASPTIEHVMQTFSGLFSRIGLNDPDQVQIECIRNDCISV